MFVGVLATDGGPHPPEKWAALTASQIIDIASSAPATLLAEARGFQAKIEGILTRHHELAQTHERDSLATEGPERLAADIDTSGHVPDAADDIVAAAKGTSFAAHFAKPEVRAYLERLLHEHFHHSMHIERLWHADANPDHPTAVVFKDRVTNGGTGALAGDPPAKAKGA
jgi:hypothetical protein